MMNNVDAVQRTVGSHYFEDSAINNIGWCSRTLNFFRGCAPVSEGCQNCYAASEGVHQVQMRANSAYATIVTTKHGLPAWTGHIDPSSEKTWAQAFQLAGRGLVFANSMSDLFHAKLADEAILFAARTMARARHVQWQVVTKRPERMVSFMSRLFMVNDELMLADEPVPPSERYTIPNLWLGVSVENQRRADERLPLLAQTNAAVRFISLEPMLGPVDLAPHVGSFDWVIVGGESGSRFRPMAPEWASAVRDVCVANNIPFFFKQHAGTRPGIKSKALDGAEWRQLPRVELLPLMSKDERREARRWVEATYARVFSGKSSASEVQS